MIYITGDIHGKLDPIYDLYQKYSPTKDDIIAILGKEEDIIQKIKDFNCNKICDII